MSMSIDTDLAYNEFAAGCDVETETTIPFDTGDFEDH